jgi:hypothetical protein
MDIPDPLKVNYKIAKLDIYEFYQVNRVVPVSYSSHYLTTEHGFPCSVPVTLFLQM